MALPPVLPMETTAGRFLVFAGRDIINRSIGKTGTWEPWTVDVAHALLTQADPRPGTIVDAGANLGAIAIPLARRLPRAYTFHCFEMQRIVYYQLCGNIVLNGLENVHAHLLGLGAADETVDVPRPDYLTDENIGAVSASQTVRAQRGSMATDRTGVATEPVRFSRLDSLNLQDVRLIKADVEGMERDVLKGAGLTLARNDYPPLILEIWKSGTPGAHTAEAEALLNHIAALGYGFQVAGSLCIAQHTRRPWLKATWDAQAQTFRTALQQP
ncbi:MAG: FkbM family methyltransferase [Rhodospirillaceae bacterium]|nr:FkbM family methyltransferase [Rhodospirillaceae bacterium]